MPKRVNNNNSTFLQHLFLDTVLRFNICMGYVCVCVCVCARARVHVCMPACACMRLRDCVSVHVDVCFK